MAKRVYPCRVCDGRGWFNQRLTRGPNKGYTITIICRTCGGKGVIYL